LCNNLGTQCNGDQRHPDYRPTSCGAAAPVGEGVGPQLSGGGGALKKRRIKRRRKEGRKKKENKEEGE